MQQKAVSDESLPSSQHNFSFRTASYVVRNPAVLDGSGVRPGPKIGVGSISNSRDKKGVALMSRRWVVIAMSVLARQGKPLHRVS